MYAEKWAVDEGDRLNNDCLTGITTSCVPTSFLRLNIPSIGRYVEYNARLDGDEDPYSDEGGVKVGTGRGRRRKVSKESIVSSNLGAEIRLQRCGFLYGIFHKRMTV